MRPPFRAHDVGFSPDGRRVWVTSGDRHEIAVYDAGSRTLLRRLYADAPPQHVISRSGVAYVTSGDDATLRLYRLADGRRIETSPIPVGSYNVSAGWGRIFSPSLERGTLSILDGRGRVRFERRIASAAHDACFAVGT